MLNEKQAQVLATLQVLKADIKACFKPSPQMNQRGEAIEHIRRLEDLIYAEVGREMEDSSLERIVQTFVRNKNPNATNIQFKVYFQTKEEKVEPHYIGSSQSDTCDSNVEAPIYGKKKARVEVEDEEEDEKGF